MLLQLGVTWQEGFKQATLSLQIKVGPKGRTGVPLQNPAAAGIKLNGGWEEITKAGQEPLQKSGFMPAMRTTLLDVGAPILTG